MNILRYETVESRAWIDPETGQNYSIYSSYVPPGCELISCGWTIQDNKRGTVGNGRPPYKDKVECDRVVARLNGVSQ